MSTPSIIALDPTVATEALEPFPREEILSGTRAQEGFTAFADVESQLTVGVWEQEKNETTWMDYPTNEFMVMIEGKAVIVENDRTVEVGPGEVFFLPKGLKCRWTQPGKVRKFFFIHEGANNPDSPSSLQTIVIDPELSGNGDDASGLLAESGPDATLFTDSSGDLTISRKVIQSGSGSGTSHAHEFVHIVKGQLEVEDGSTVHQFQRGESFFIPRGARLKWSTNGPVRMVSAHLIP